MQADVFIDHDTQGTKDVKVHVTCTVKGDQLTVDLTGTDDRQELVGVWNTFGNSRSYVMTQIAASIDPTDLKNEGLFNAVEMIIPEGTIAQPPINKPAALGSFHPACEITEAVCVALSRWCPERCAPQVYKIGMPNAVIGFRERADVDGSGRRCALDGCLGRAGHRWLGLMSGGARQSAAVGSGRCGEPFPIINISREMVDRLGGAGQWRGSRAA